MVVGAAHRVGFRMGKLRLNGIRAIAHFVQPGAARGSGAMRAVGAAPAQHLERLPDRMHRHRSVAVIPAGKEVCPVAADGVQAAQHLYGLRRQRHNMFATGFHAPGWDRPKRRIEIEFSPFRLCCLARACQCPPHQLDAEIDLIAAAVVVEVVEQLADLRGGQRRLVLRLVGGQRLADGPDRIVVCPQGGDRQFEDAGHGAFGFGGDGRRTALHGLGEDVENVRRGDVAHRELADAGEDHPLQHVQAPLLGDVLPVPQSQPLFGDGLEGIGGILFALEALKLPVLDGVDALLDQLPRFLALVSRFSKADGRIVTQREPRSLAAQLEAVAPSLYPIGLHFEVKAAKVIQAVELLLRFGSTAVGICKHGVTGSAIRNDRRIIYTFRRLVQSSYTPT